MAPLTPVPAEVSRVASLALSHRAERGGGGTARGVVIATALGTGVLTDHELAELRDWHARHPEAIHDDGACTLLAGLYGGTLARDVWPPAETPPPQTAAPRSPLATRLAKLSKVSNATDRATVLRLHAGATVALEEALRHAGVKLATKARTKAARASVTAAAGVYPPALLAAIGVTEQELLDRKFEAYALTAVAIIAAAERRKLAETAAALDLDPDVLEEQYGPEIDRRAAAAAAYLVLSLSVLARAALSGHGVTAESTQGEFSGPVPFGIVRDAWTIAARGASAPMIDEAGPGPAAIDQLGRALTDAGATLIEELLAEHVGAVVMRSTWSVGDPSRPFEPHQNLDAVSWIDTQPEELAADPGEWPYVDVYQPGDHDGCQCLIETEYEPYEPDSGDSGDASGDLAFAEA